MSKCPVLPCLTALTVSLLLASPAHAVLPPGVSGAWFNPSQSGGLIAR